MLELRLETSGRWWGEGRLRVNSHILSYLTYPKKWLAPLLKILATSLGRLVIYILNYLYITFFNKSIYYIQKKYVPRGGECPFPLPS
jgi:hypothetical protein